jgi:hypothetical protein
MHHYRQVLVRLRQGDSDRDVARSRLMGRPKVAAFRALAAAQGWLEPAAVLPEDAALAAAVGRARRARSTISSVEPYRAVVERWLDDGKRPAITSPRCLADQCTRITFAGFQTCGISSTSRCSGVSGKRSSTSRRYA